MNQLMKQAQKMQRELEKAQEAAAEMTGTASVGGGMITVTINAQHEIQELEIDPAVIDPEDPDMLKDMFIAAVNEAVRDLDEKVEGVMGKATGGVNLGGMLGM